MRASSILARAENATEQVIPFGYRTMGATAGRKGRRTVSWLVAEGDAVLQDAQRLAWCFSRTASMSWWTMA